MKKLASIILMFSILGTIPTIMPKNFGVLALRTVTGQQDQQQQKLTPSPVGNKVQNQNTTETQNQGEESQLQVNTQEQVGLGDEQGGGSQNRSQRATQSMSIVAQKVQELMQMETTGGIGDQVRQVAREQSQAQIQILEQLNKLESKSKFSRFFSGTDYGAVKNLKIQLEQNQLRIKQLQQLQNQLNNEGDMIVVKETILALINENTLLQEQVTLEEKTKSMFGWVFRYFAK